MLQGQSWADLGGAHPTAWRGKVWPEPVGCSRSPHSLRCSLALSEGLRPGAVGWPGPGQGAHEKQVLGFTSLHNDGFFPFLEESLSLDTYSKAVVK